MNGNEAMKGKIGAQKQWTAQLNIGACGMREQGFKGEATHTGDPSVDGNFLKICHSAIYKVKYHSLRKTLEPGGIERSGNL